MTLLLAGVVILIGELGGLHFVPPHPSPTAIELRSADFSPLPCRLGETAGGELKSALLLARTTPKSTAVPRGSGQGFGPELSRTGEGKRRFDSRRVSTIQRTPQ